VTTLNKYVTKIPVILGPTAVGKTEVSLLLAERIGGEIISADAFQVYRGMDIGTAKPAPAELSRVPHHLINILKLNEQYSAARFRSLALDLIEDIRSRKAIPMVVGGSGLYIKALTDGLFEAPPSDQKYRDFLRQEEASKGSGYLHGLLFQQDPVSAGRIHPHNLKRVVRALEVLKLTGVPISRWQNQWRNEKDERQTSNNAEPHQPATVNRQRSSSHSPFPIPYSLVGLRRTRDDLYSRINRRVLEMFDHGLVEETEELLKKGLMDNRVARQALGYREVQGYLTGEYDRDEAIKRLSTKTRHFAKRQLTWWRSDNRIQWIDLSEKDRIENVVDGMVEILD
jgi:tRNA dimethylallyltransferase